MKRLALIAVFLLTLCTLLNASHITGGEMYYTFAGIDNNGYYKYNISLKLYQRCNSGRQFPNPAVISIFNRTNNLRWADLNVNISSTENIAITNPDPCIENHPFVCYDVAYYHFQVALPPSAAGYVLASQVNYRIAGIDNLAPGYNNVGATYTAEIPGNSLHPTGPDNRSARFVGSDLVVVCANNNFEYSFAATDADDDELRYSFCQAYASTSTTGGIPTPTNPPPFPSVPYNLPNFQSSFPLGSSVQINPSTGLISGIAPVSGTYVVTVCVEEVRDGQVIATQRKDLQIFIAQCQIAEASLSPEYLLCGTNQTLALMNQANSSLIVTQDWEVRDDLGNLITTATGNVFNYTYPAGANYEVKLVINRGQPCNDSTTAIIRVWPGFAPNFNSTGICVNKPVQFSDQTQSVYGTVNYWDWDFGDLTTTTDHSSIQHPAYSYPGAGPKTVLLTVGDSKGCRDTISKVVNIIDKPEITLAFRDTLICVPDNVTLQASGSGNFSWSPAVNMINGNTATPTVAPLSSTVYYVDLDISGCSNRDSVNVRVVHHVTLDIMADTTICSTDTIQLRIHSDGLRFIWSPASQVIEPTIQNPFVVTGNTTNYSVTASIGSCTSTKSVVVNTVPYPVVNAGIDTIICYNTHAFLKGYTDGTIWSWSPPNRVTDPNSLHTIAMPPRNTAYVLTAYDTKGCPKPGRDTVVVNVYPKMNVSAGNDTSVVTGQPLHLIATGADDYVWSPSYFLSATNIYDPIAIFPGHVNNIKYKVVGITEAGCRDSAWVSVNVYKTGPEIFIPTAFTPNNDGKNDLLRPIAVGIRKIEYFSVYNRWGQLLFSTSINGHGWDGKINGQLQSNSTFVWMVKAVDYNGRDYFRKGVVTLIR